MSDSNSNSSGSIGYSKMNNSSSSINRNSSQKYSFRSSIDLPDVETSKTTHSQQSSSPVFTVLRRNCSVSSSSATTSSTSSGRFQSAVKRALSLRRSSSVSAESYSRIIIHHEDEDEDEDDDDDHGDTDTTCIPKPSSSTSVSNKEIRSRGSGKILKACKRLLFGL